MRVCILTRSDLFPTHHGAAVKIIETARALSSLYEEPCFIAIENRDFYWRIEGDSQRKIQYGLRFRAFQEWPPFPALNRFAETICERIGYPKEEYFLYAPQFDPLWFVRVLYIGMKEKVDVFQAEFPGYGIPAVAAAQALRAHRAWTGGRQPISSIVQHNVEWDRLQEFGHSVTGIQKVECLALSMVDEVIAVSQADKRRMVAAGIEPKKITVIPHGVDVERFSKATGLGIRERYAIDPDAPLLFFHGTLHYWPNTEAVRFIAEKMLPALTQVLPTVRILICGMNPPLYYQHPAIVFTGAVDDLEEHIAAADICICPLFAGGGTRLKLLEYMAAGKAIVSTGKGAEGIPFREQLVLADQVSTMVESILLLLRNESKKNDIEQRAKRFALQLSWRTVTKAYTTLYQGLGRGEDWSQTIHDRDIESHLPVRKKIKNRTLLLLVNRGCNLRCSFCDLWEGQEHFPIDRIPQLLDDAVAIGTEVLVLTGGEPLLYPHIFTVIREAKQRGLAVNMTTNGTLIDRYWDQISTSQIDSLSVSIDGLEEVHDRLRGQKGAYQKTIRALQRLQEYGKISRSVYFVATNENVHQLKDVFEISRSLGCSFDFWPVNDAEELYIQKPKDVRIWEESVEYIAKQAKRVYQNKAFYDDGMAYHSHRLEGRSVRCLGFVEQYGVTYDGSFLPCCVWGKEELQMGNVFQTSLRELWFSPEIQAYRKKLYQEGCTVGCFNHSLYEFMESTGQHFVVGELSELEASRMQG